MAPVTALTISKQMYDHLSQHARAAQRDLNEFAETLLRAQIQPTDHPYVVRRGGQRGGSPVIRGSDIPIWLIVAMWRAGDSLDDIGQAYPYLNPAALYDAISYYFDHRQEIEAEIRQNRIAQVLADTGAEFDNEGRLTFPDNHGG
ncbi:MAG: DUF433 domain-containing protein [Anaerolineae bacterium]|uniref:DUF433 domain-containing protein n=1 Tax=Candidatus Amarolinea dominans TaxID=3140696 RepID=UPI003136C62C|nr:DUF433 domain-containing protein [Anaerolineae bacterium]